MAISGYGVMIGGTANYIHLNSPVKSGNIDAGNSTITASTFVGALTGNASSATKLQNTRTIWGQSFNGEGNVSGNISNTGNITPSATAARNIGTSSLMYERAYLRRIDTQSGYDLRLNVAGNEYMTIDTSGNVGIGTTSPAYKLDVSGTGRFTGNVTAPTFIGALDGNAKTVTNGVYTNNSQTITGTKTFDTLRSKKITLMHPSTANAERGIFEYMEGTSG